MHYVNDPLWSRFRGRAPDADQESLSCTASAMHHGEATHAAAGDHKGTHVRASSSGAEKRRCIAWSGELCAPCTSHVASVKAAPGLDQGVFRPASLWIRHRGPSPSIVSAG
jgi:hypothetical protein